MIRKVWLRIREVLPGRAAGIGVLLVLIAAVGVVSWKMTGAGQAKQGSEARTAKPSQNVIARLASRFKGAPAVDGGKKLVVSPRAADAAAVDCLALPVQDEQGLIWCIRRDRPSELACWDGEQWRFTELPGIAADPRGPDGAVILVDDADRVLVISAGGTAEFGPGEIDVEAFEAEYRQNEYLFVDKGVISRLERKTRDSGAAYRISSLSPADIANIFNSLLRRHDLCSRVNIQRLELGRSYLVQKVRTCDNNSSSDMIITANKLLFSRMYPRTFARACRERSYRLKRSSPGAVETFPDSLTLLTDSVRSGSRAFRENAGRPPLVYKKKIVYDGKCFGSDTLNFAYVGRDALTGTWQENLVAVQFAAGDAAGKAAPSKCMLCGPLSSGIMRVMYEDGGKPRKQTGPAVLAGAVKPPEHIEGVYPFKGGFSYFDPATESIVFCSSGGAVSEIRLNEGLIGRAGIQVFDEAVYAKNSGALFPVRKSGDGLLVFASAEDFNHVPSSGTAGVKAVKLPGHVRNVYPVPGGFAVNDHQAGTITVYLKDRVIETDAAFYAANKLGRDSALFADAKGNIWIHTGGRFIELPRDEVFPR